MKLPRITRILTRRPALSLAAGETTRTWLGEPDINLAFEQYDAYLQTFRDRNLDVITLAPDEKFPDGHYVEDPAVAFGDVIFITRPGAASRTEETQSMSHELAMQFADKTLVFAEGDDTMIDGGDVLFTANRVLIGLSKRTNLAGAEQLKAAILAWDASAKVDFVPQTGVLHLKTGMTELAPGVLLQDPHMKIEYTPPEAEIVVLSEAEGYAANVLPINDDFVLIPKGYPTVAALAQKHYADVIELNMSEFEKMDGSLTCLSLRLSD